MKVLDLGPRRIAKSDAGAGSHRKLNKRVKTTQTITKYLPLSAGNINSVSNYKENKTEFHPDGSRETYLQSPSFSCCLAIGRLQSTTGQKGESRPPFFSSAKPF